VGGCRWYASVEDFFVPSISDMFDAFSKSEWLECESLEVLKNLNFWRNRDEGDDSAVREELVVVIGPRWLPEDS
jgi:hypothetical protein